MRSQVKMLASLWLAGATMQMQATEFSFPPTLVLPSTRSNTDLRSALTTLADSLDVGHSLDDEFEARYNTYQFLNATPTYGAKAREFLIQHHALIEADGN